MVLGFLLAVGATLPLLSAPAHADGDDITGWWYEQTRRGGILIEPCGRQLCGKVAWLLQPLDPTGAQLTDSNDPDDKLRTRPICQLRVLGGFNHTGRGEWEDGWIYNPEDGDTYRSRMVLQDDGTLRVRGFILVPWFGKSQIWTRPTEQLQECKPT